MNSRVPTPAAAFAKQHDFLVAVDSDGCAMDTMTFKHLHCFTPQIIRFWGLGGCRVLRHLGGSSGRQGFSVDGESPHQRRLSAGYALA